MADLYVCPEHGETNPCSGCRATTERIGDHRIGDIKFSRVSASVAPTVDDKLIADIVEAVNRSKSINSDGEWWLDVLRAKARVRKLLLNSHPAPTASVNTEDLWEIVNKWRSERDLLGTRPAVTEDYGVLITAIAERYFATEKRSSAPASTVAPQQSEHHKHCSSWTVNTSGERQPCDCVCECTHSMFQHIRPGEHYWYEDCAVEGCPCLKFTAAADPVADREGFESTARVAGTLNNIAAAATQAKATAEEAREWMSGSEPVDERTTPASTAAPARHYFCSCGGALTAEEYIEHYFEKGHDRGEPALLAKAAAREWMNKHHASFETNQAREEALTAIILKRCFSTEGEDTK